MVGHRSKLEGKKLQEGTVIAESEILFERLDKKLIEEAL